MCSFIVSLFLDSWCRRRIWCALFYAYLITNLWLIYFLVLVIWRPSHEDLFCNRTPKALIARHRSKTSRKVNLKFIDSSCNYQKGSLTDLWLFCSENYRKIVVFYSNLIWTISLLLLYLRGEGNERDFDALNGYQRLFNFLFVLRIKLAQRSLVWFSCFFKTIVFWLYNF